MDAIYRRFIGFRSVLGLCLFISFISAGIVRSQEKAGDPGAERLWEAARAGDIAAVNRELDAGVDVNAATAYQLTALSYASDHGHLEVARLLLARGANPNVKDSFYQKTPLMGAQSGKHYELITLLLENGATGGKQLLLDGVVLGDKQIVEAVLKADAADADTLASAVLQAKALDQAEFVEIFAPLKVPVREIPPLTPEALASFAGKYAETKDSFTMEVREGKKGLEIDFGNDLFRPWFAFGEMEFHRGGNRIIFEKEDGKIIRAVLESGGRTFELTPRESDEVAAVPKPSDSQPMDSEESANESEHAVPAELAHRSSSSDIAASSKNWPGFRGTHARGIADGQHPPVSWNLDTGTNVAWITPIRGFGNSCPVVWGDRLLITSASSPDGNTDVRIGQYGDVDSVEDENLYDFILYCLDKRTGEILWQRTCNTAKPAVKRHSKSSHANPTVVTDGVHVIAWFGSEGLYAFDFDGNQLWSRDLGVLDSGWFFDPSYQWGFGSSPTIYQNRLFIQCDIQKGSFVAALDLATGKDVWRTERDEIPTWSSPIVYPFGDLPMLVTHGTRAARGYDARDGKLLWWLADQSEIVVPTPNVAHNTIFLASGYAPIQPIVAVRPEARGELQLPGRAPKGGSESLSEKASEPPKVQTPFRTDSEARETEPGIVWSTQRGGPYMPTPLIYGDFLYVCANQGIVTCYRAQTGEELYKKRLRGGETLSFTASPIAADGHLYFTSESGHVYIVQAGGVFKQLSVHSVGGKVLATPAISERMLFVRTVDKMIAFSGSSEGELGAASRFQTLGDDSR